MEKHYRCINAVYKERFGSKVAKIPLNAGFTCPNKDGLKGVGGCTYCSKKGSGDTALSPRIPLKIQFYQIKKRMDAKWKQLKYIPYLQANSNTYASLDRLKEIYEEILSFEPQQCVALAIATRPDCLSKEIYDYLEQINRRKKVIVELGLQSANEQTAKRINRCSSNEELIQAVLELHQRKIETVVHIINGLPGETETDMLSTIDFINQLPIDGIKIHCLLILKDTPLYEEYRNQPFHVLSLDEYISICCKQIARMKKDVVIHRLCADALKDDLVAPLWSRNKRVVHNQIDRYLKEHNLYQGDQYKKSQKL